MKRLSDASFFLLTLCVSVSTITIKCDQRYYGNSDEKCTLRGLNFSSTEVESFDFPVYASFEMKDCFANYLSPAIMKRMQWVSTLSITGGAVSKIYLKPDLFILKASGSKTVEIVIDNITDNKSLVRLEIVSNYLIAVPSNINQLKSLSKLNLKYNRIQYLNLSDFIGLDNLTEIDLSGNRLYAIMSNRNVNLGNLVTLDVSNNLLAELDFTNWKLSTLKTLSVKENSLRFIKQFDEKTFPSLVQLTHYNNLWDCRWSNRFNSVFLRVTNIGNQANYGDYTTTAAYDYGYGSTATAANNYASIADPLQCSKSTQLSASLYRQLNLTAIDDEEFKVDNLEEVEDQLRLVVEDTNKQATNFDILKQTVIVQQNQITELLTQTQTQQSLLDSLNSKIQSLEEQLQNTMSSHSCSRISEVFMEELIMKISHVIRRTFGYNFHA
ncbi:uncharacterized protein LOC128737770 [Sabethes cyaneus]|uniref:uncharacterized protein LOC128737770 n=1 Tax=Sabethes cyaneus TaxID=53552 RepID=UPI00237E939F|nr:uncharacterized protein LOC128737770 [Sabethes cyaneus]